MESSRTFDTAALPPSNTWAVTMQTAQNHYNSHTHMNERTFIQLLISAA